MWSSWAWVSTMPRMSSACSSMKVGSGRIDLDARRRLVAEGDAEVDDDPLASVRRAEAVEIEVHADLVRPAERQEDEFVVRFALAWSLSRVPAVDFEHAADGQVGIEVVDGRCRPWNSEATPPVPITVIGLAPLGLDARDQAFDQGDIAPEDAGLHGRHRVLADDRAPASGSRRAAGAPPSCRASIDRLMPAR